MAKDKETKNVYDDEVELMLGSIVDCLKIKQTDLIDKIRKKLQDKFKQSFEKDIQKELKKARDNMVNHYVDECFKGKRHKEEIENGIDELLDKMIK
jgi:predicted Holliday junction resolvase-like endonuclease